jgi:hypothetical protein
LHEFTTFIHWRTGLGPIQILKLVIVYIPDENACILVISCLIHGPSIVIGLNFSLKDK